MTTNQKKKKRKKVQGRRRGQESGHSKRDWVSRDTCKHCGPWRLAVQYLGNHSTVYLRAVTACATDKMLIVFTQNLEVRTREADSEAYWILYNSRTEDLDFVPCSCNLLHGLGRAFVASTLGCLYNQNRLSTFTCIYIHTS